MSKPVTHQVNEAAIAFLERHREGIQWSKLNKMIEKKYPDFHPKTINGCVWKLTEKYPDKVHKPEKGLFKLLK